jgi:predicted MPP superfamily phosphohydrolase
MPVSWTLILIVACLLAAVGYYATRIEPYRPVLRRFTHQVPENWPRLSILHISDLHVRAYADDLYRSQNRLLRSIDAQPDLVCVTGDVCETLADVPRAVALIHQLQPRIGIFVIPGNHEHDAPIPVWRRKGAWSVARQLEKLVWRLFGPRYRSSGTAESRAIAAAMDRAGLRVLVNKGHRIEVDGRPLWIAGVDSVWAGLARAAEALSGRQPHEPVLGLVHEPEAVFPFIARGAALVLAGHTHGGQVRLPFFGPPYSHRTDRRIRVSAGVQRIGQSHLHISAGLGHSISLRFNCPPEATWIECVPSLPHEPGLALTELSTLSEG